METIYLSAITDPICDRFYFPFFSNVSMFCFLTYLCVNILLPKIYVKSSFILTFTDDKKFIHQILLIDRLKKPV
jgi:hypothetical protein